MLNPQGGIVPADVVSQMQLMVKLDHWWQALSVAEKAGAYRDVALAETTRRDRAHIAAGHPGVRRDDDPVHEQ